MFLFCLESGRRGALLAGKAQQCDGGDAPRVAAPVTLLSAARLHVVRGQGRRRAVGRVQRRDARRRPPRVTCSSPSRTRSPPRLVGRRAADCGQQRIARLQASFGAGRPLVPLGVRGLQVRAGATLRCCWAGAAARCAVRLPGGPCRRCPSVSTRQRSGGKGQGRDVTPFLFTHRPRRPRCAVSRAFCAFWRHRSLPERKNHAK